MGTSVTEAKVSDPGDHRYRSFGVLFKSALVQSITLCGDIWAQHRNASTATAPIWKLLIAPLRALISAAVVTYLIARVKPRNRARSLLLGLVLWGWLLCSTNGWSRNLRQHALATWCGACRRLDENALHRFCIERVAS